MTCIPVHARWLPWVSPIVKLDTLCSKESCQCFRNVDNSKVAISVLTQWAYAWDLFALVVETFKCTVTTRDIWTSLECKIFCILLNLQSRLQLKKWCSTAVLLMVIWRVGEMESEKQEGSLLLGETGFIIRHSARVEGWYRMKVHNKKLEAMCSHR